MTKVVQTQCLPKLAIVPRNMCFGAKSHNMHHNSQKYQNVPKSAEMHESIPSKYQHTPNRPISANKYQITPNDTRQDYKVAKKYLTTPNTPDKYPTYRTMLTHMNK